MRSLLREVKRRAAAVGQFDVRYAQSTMVVEPLTEDDETVIETARGCDQRIAVLNKSDLPPAFSPDDLKGEVPRCVCLSANSRENPAT